MKTSPETTSTRRPRLRRLLKALAAAVMLAASAATAVQLWVAPALIRDRVRSALEQRWAGTVSVGEVGFSYFGPIRLREVSLLGPAGREWVRVEDVALTLRNWPGPHPFLTAVDVRGVRLTGHFNGGRCELPVRQPAGPEREGADAAAEYLDLQSVRVRDLAVALLDHDTGAGCAWRLNFAADRRSGGRYEVRLAEDAPPASATPILSGEVDPATLDSRLRVKLHHRLDAGGVNLLLAAVGSTPLHRAEGSVDVGGSIAGRLDRPKAWKVDGTVELTDGRAEAAEGPILTDLDLAVRVNGGHAMVTAARAVTPAGVVSIGASPVDYDVARGTVSALVREIVVTAAGGDYGGFWRRILGGVTARGEVLATGEVSYNPARAQPLTYDFEAAPRLDEVRFPNSPDCDLRDVTCERISIGTTTVRAQALSATFAKGRAKLTAVARLRATPGAAAPPQPADWADIEKVQAAGQLYMDDVDLVGVPVLPGLLELMQVLPKGHKGLSDLDAKLSLDGGIVTIEQARLANPVSALDVEKGGTIDVRSTQLDMHVVVVGVKQLRTVLQAIPLLNLAVDFKDKLTRFRIRGPWDAPPAKLVTKEPLADIGEGTVDFFKGVAKTGGQIGPAIIEGVKGIGELFKKLDEAIKKKPDK